MQTGNFSGTQYSKSGSTKSSYTKRKLVYEFIGDYPGGATKCFQDFDTKSPTWLYENKKIEMLGVIIIFMLLL